MSKHLETVRHYADDLSLNRGIPSGDLHAAADYIEQLEAENERLRELVADKLTELDQEMGLQ